MNYNTHSFSVELATKVGLESALLLQHFFCWYEGNKDNPDMIKEGKVWFFTSRKSMLNVFPYLTDRIIRTRIDALIEGGYLVKGNFANNKLLRTNWYALTNKTLSLFNTSLVKKDAPLVEVTDDWSKRPMKKIYNKDNNINITNKELVIINNKQESMNDDDIKKQFEEFRKKFPGRKRGFEVEFENFKKKHKNWREIVALLLPAIERQIEYRNASVAKGLWVPQWANLSTWLNQSRWEEELPDLNSASITQESSTARALRESREAFERIAQRYREEKKDIEEINPWEGADEQWSHKKS